MMPMRVLSRWRQSVAALLPEGIILEALIIALVLLLLDLL